MRLDLATWPEIEAYLKRSDGVIVPLGSTEQHGPIGLIGTDALCAEGIAVVAAERANALVAPTIGYTPAPFNMAFPGTLSISEQTFTRLVGEVIDGLVHHGFRHIYLLNGHGANLQPIRRVLAGAEARCRLCSWWDFEAVNALRQSFYGAWEGMHATPSEIAITQHLHRVVEAEALPPPEPLSADYIKAHAGDRHGPPDAHRAQFPDGRVGSHSALATPDQGRQLFDAAVRAVSDDYLAFLGNAPSTDLPLD